VIVILWTKRKTNLRTELNSKSHIQGFFFLISIHSDNVEQDTIVTLPDIFKNSKQLDLIFLCLYTLSLIIVCPCEILEVLES
jgi:hypothetical protein